MFTRALSSRLLSGLYTQCEESKIDFVATRRGFSERSPSPSLLPSLLVKSEQPSGSTSSNAVGWNNNWDLRYGRQGKAIRQIVLIRHGQYDQTSKKDEKRKLTELGVCCDVSPSTYCLLLISHFYMCFNPCAISGREQATLTGQRLRELVDAKIIFPIHTIHYSTMKRATETFQCILPSLPAMEEHQLQPCSMITEGAVCRPSPTSVSWHPSEEEFEKDGLRVSSVLSFENLSTSMNFLDIIFFNKNCQLAFNLQVEAAFANYFHRAVAKSKHHHNEKDNDKLKELNTNTAGSVISIENEDEEDSGNYSDVFVCHGMGKIMLFWSFSYLLFVCLEARTICHCGPPNIDYNTIILYRKCDTIFCYARTTAPSRSLAAHSCVQRFHHSTVHLSQWKS